MSGRLTIDRDAVAQVAVAQNLLSARNGQGGATPAAGGVILLLQRGDG